MVLGISSLMIGGALAWFDARKSSDFYDQMRQVESRIREVQSENTTSIVPGYDSSASSPCNTKERKIGSFKCVIGEREEVYATAVSMAVNAANTGSPDLKIWYLKKSAPSGTPLQSEEVLDYGTRTVDLPANVRFEGYKVFPPTGPNRTCVAPAALNGYRSLPFQEVASVGERSVTTPNSESLMVFRRTTGGYNAFDASGAISFNPAAIPVSKARPVWDNSTNINPAWRGNYDDSSYQYSSFTEGRLRSQPCAVLWRFGTLERKAGSPSEPRFTAEINFNLVDGTTTLVTR